MILEQADRNWRPGRDLAVGRAPCDAPAGRAAAPTRVAERGGDGASIPPFRSAHAPSRPRRHGGSRSPARLARPPRHRPRHRVPLPSRRARPHRTAQGPTVCRRRAGGRRRHAPRRACVRDDVAAPAARRLRRRRSRPHAGAVRRSRPRDAVSARPPPERGAHQLGVLHLGSHGIPHPRATRRSRPPAPPGRARSAECRGRHRSQASPGTGSAPAGSAQVRDAVTAPPRRASGAALRAPRWRAVSGQARPVVEHRCRRADRPALRLVTAGPTPATATTPRGAETPQGRGRARPILGLRSTTPTDAVNPLEVPR